MDSRPRTTPQQALRDDVDDRGTQPHIFESFDERFGPFTLDVAAAAHNAKCARYYDRDADGLRQPWGRSRVWCNPPYSAIEPWIRKAWGEWLARPHMLGQTVTHTDWTRRVDGPDVIVMLLPANRTEQKWWQELVEPHRDKPGSPLRVEFLPGRMRFIRAGSHAVGPNERPPFGVCLLIWEATP